MPSTIQSAPKITEASSREMLVAVPSSASEVPRRAGGDSALPSAISTPSVAA